LIDFPDSLHSGLPKQCASPIRSKGVQLASLDLGNRGISALVHENEMDALSHGEILQQVWRMDRERHRHGRPAEGGDGFMSQGDRGCAYVDGSNDALAPRCLRYGSLSLALICEGGQREGRADYGQSKGTRQEPGSHLTLPS